MPTINTKNKEKHSTKEESQSKPFIHKSIKEYITLEERYKNLMHPLSKEKVVPYQEWLKGVEEYFKLQNSLKNGKLLISDEVRGVLNDAKSNAKISKVEATKNNTNK